MRTCTRFIDVVYLVLLAWMARMRWEHEQEHEEHQHHKTAWILPGVGVSVLSVTGIHIILLNDIAWFCTLLMKASVKGSAGSTLDDSGFWQTRICQ